MKKSLILFRKAELQDFDEIKRLIQQVHDFHQLKRPDFYRESDHPMKIEDYKELMDNPETDIYVLATDTAVIGYAFTRIMYFRDNTRIIDHRRFFIDDICIDKALRKKGYGRRLMNELEGVGRSLGIRYMDLNVWNFNTDAYEFYQKYGMKPVITRMEKLVE